MFLTVDDRQTFFDQLVVHVVINRQPPCSDVPRAKPCRWHWSIASLVFCSWLMAFPFLAVFFNFLHPSVFCLPVIALHVNYTHAHTARSLMQVMSVNGVSHHVVADDLEGASAVLHWLGTMPPLVGLPPAHLPTADPLDRPIAYAPQPGTSLYVSAC